MQAYLLSINPPYSEMIFDKRKRYEFRTVIMKAMKPDDRMYIYETKKRKGCGKIIGYAVIKKIVGPAIKSKDDEYVYFHEDMFEEVRKDLWDDFCEIYDNEKMSDKEFEEESEKFLDDAGFLGVWNYAIRIGKVHRFAEPKELSEFIGKNGPVTHPPQNMMGIIVED